MEERKELVAANSEVSKEDIEMYDSYDEYWRYA